jgi:hypothetical protein
MRSKQACLSSRISHWIARFARSAVLVLLLTAAASPASAISREYEIKAAYLYNFINYIDWPGSSAGGTITIGVLGDNPFGPALAALNGKSAKGRRIAVREVSQAAELKGCQIAFISSSEKQRTSQILDTLTDTRVLTVGETDGFAERGGMINFISEHNKVRFEINVDAARRRGLTISSELLKLARLVKS